MEMHLPPKYEVQTLTNLQFAMQSGPKLNMFIDMNYKPSKEKKNVKPSYDFEHSQPAPDPQPQKLTKNSNSSKIFTNF